MKRVGIGKEGERMEESKGMSKKRRRKEWIWEGECKKEPRGGWKGREKGGGKGKGENKGYLFSMSLFWRHER